MTESASQSVFDRRDYEDGGCGGIRLGDDAAE
jgi:hypothetical protein